MKILDVGCGLNKIPNSIGIDIIDLPGVDIIHDINLLPWPFEDGQFNAISFTHSISHLKDIPSIIKECHRILAPGGIIEIIAPHFSSDNNFTDPTHKSSFSSRSMMYFTADLGRYKYINDEFRFSLLKNELSFLRCHSVFRKRIPIFYKVISFIPDLLINFFPRLYERFFVWILPASEVRFILQK